jgi:DNA-binding NarL/FixJ family response regulator
VHKPLTCVCGASGEELLSEVEAHISLEHDPGQRRRGALTPMELRVAALVSEGLSNPAVARRLQVTPKTVETHLSHVYRNLGVRSRVALTAVVASDAWKKRL